MKAFKYMLYYLYASKNRIITPIAPKEDGNYILMLVVIATVLIPMLRTHLYISLAW